MAIDLADLPGALKKVWDAVVPPVIQLVLCAAAVLYVLGIPHSVIALGTRANSVALLPSPEVQEALKFYGVTSILPIAAAMALIGFAQAVGFVTGWIGGLVPGRLLPNRTALFYAANSEWNIKQLWRYHPNLRGMNGLNTLDSIIDEEVERASRNPDAHRRMRSAHWSRDRIYRYSNRIAFYKGVGALVISAWLFAPLLTESTTRPTQRLCAVLAIIAAGILFETRRAVRAAHEYCSIKTHAYLDWKDVSAGGLAEPDAQNWEQDSKVYKELGRLGDEIWIFEIWSPRGDEPARHMAEAVWRFVRRGVQASSRLVRALKLR